MQYGHFDNDRREYVIDRVDLPASWTNYLGTEEMCAVVNHTAGGYLFHKSAEYHRITRFRANAVPMDRPGHYIYLRDDDTGEYWSVSWQPVGKPLDWAKYTCRHGLSYTKYECEYGGIRADAVHSPGRGCGDLGPFVGEYLRPGAEHQRVQLRRAVVPPYRYGQPQLSDEPVCRGR